jgi:hypothetical protein
MQEIKDIKKEIEQRLRRQGDTPITIEEAGTKYVAASIPAELRINIYRYDVFNKDGEPDTWESEYSVSITMRDIKYQATGIRYLDDIRRFITKILSTEG